MNTAEKLKKAVSTIKGINNQKQRVMDILIDKCFVEGVEQIPLAAFGNNKRVNKTRLLGLRNMGLITIRFNDNDRKGHFYELNYKRLSAELDRYERLSTPPD